MNDKNRQKQFIFKTRIYYQTKLAEECHLEHVVVIVSIVDDNVYV